MPGVPVASGRITLTRILRSRSSLAQVGANDRSVAVIAVYTPMPSLPSAFVSDEFRMIDPPSFSSGSALCRCSCVTSPIRETSMAAALAKTTSRRRPASAAAV